MVRDRKVAIVVDSSACILSELLQRYDISVVPHVLVINGQAYRDGVDLGPSEFYRLLQRNLSVPSTAAPKPVDFLNAFTSMSQRSESILCLTLADAFSSTYNSARVAKEMAASSLPDVPIRVLDTRAAAGAAGLVALEAARRAQEGADLDEVTRRVEELIPEVHLIATLDTLFYLARGGRVPKVAAWAGSLLGMKPIAELKLGEARLLEKPRSRSKAIARMLTIMKERVSTRPIHVNVMHTDALQDAEVLQKQVARDFNCVENFISEFTPVMGAHLGPGLLGLAFYPEP